MTRALFAGLIVAGLSVSASASVLVVGQGSYATLGEAIAAASAGAVLQVGSGVYLNDFVSIDKPLTIVGVGPTTPIFDASGLIPNGKAIIIVNADLTIRNLEFRNAKVTDNNGAGIRHHAGDLTVEDSIFRANQDGILGGHNAGDSVVIRNSTFIDNGAGDGQSHALYINEVDSLTVTGSTFIGTKIGHDIKSRALVTTLIGNILDDGVSGTASYAIDLPNGGVGVIRGNVITQGPNTDNPTMIAYGAEGNLHPSSSLLVEDNIFTNTRPGSSIGVKNFTDSVVAELVGNTFLGVATPLVGPGRITDAPPPPPADVPEPSSALLLMAGLAGVLMLSLGSNRAARTDPPPKVRA